MSSASERIQQRIDELLTEYEEVQQRILDFTLELTAVPRTRAADTERQAKQHALKEAEEESAIVQDNIARLRKLQEPSPATDAQNAPSEQNSSDNRTPSPTPSTGTSEQPPVGSSTTRSWLPHTRQGFGGKNKNQELVPTTLPMYPSHKGKAITMESCITLFEIAVVANGLTLDVHWTRLLPACLDADTVQWLCTCVPCDIPWAQAKERILRQSGDQHSRRTHLRQLYSLQQPTSEPVVSFARRFHTLAMKAGYTDDDRFAIDHLLNLLPHEFGLHVSSALLMGHCDKSLIAIGNFLQSVPGADRPLKGNNATVALPQQPKRALYCMHHGKGTHSTDKCRFMQNRNSDKGSSSNNNNHYRNGNSSGSRNNRNPASSSSGSRTQAPRGPQNAAEQSNNTCYHCGENGHFARDCPVEKASFRRALQRQREGDEPDPREVPVLINDYRTLAFADTGSDRILITQSFASDLGLAIHPTPCQLELGVPGTPTALIGETEPGTLCFQSQALVVEYVVEPKMHDKDSSQRGRSRSCHRA